MTFVRDGVAAENRDGGYWRIQGVLVNLGHEVAGATIANIIKEQAGRAFVFSTRTVV